MHIKCVHSATNVQTFHGHVKFTQNLVRFPQATFRYTLAECQKYVRVNSTKVAVKHFCHDCLMPILQT